MNTYHTLPGNELVKRQAMRMHADGHAVKHIRRVTGVAKSTISEWIRNAAATSQKNVRGDSFNAPMRDLRD